jgi:predicted HicB family RNase H-like nuclease
MSKNTYPLKLPVSVKKAAAELAATDGVSLNQFIAAAVATANCAPGPCFSAGFCPEHN